MTAEGGCCAVWPFRQVKKIGEGWLVARSSIWGVKVPTEERYSKTVVELLPSVPKRNLCYPEAWQSGLLGKDPGLLWCCGPSLPVVEGRLLSLGHASGSHQAGGSPVFPLWCRHLEESSSLRPRRKLRWDPVPVFFLGLLSCVPGPGLDAASRKGE